MSERRLGHARSQWFEDVTTRQILPDVLEAHRGESVAEYTEGFWKNSVEPLVPETRQHVINSIGGLTERLLGTETANLARYTVSKSGVLQTTNHGGLSTWDVQVQAQLAAALRSPYPALVVGAGENVHFKSESSGRGGIVLSKEVGEGLKARKVFIPLYPLRQESVLVAVAEPFSGVNIAYGIQNADEMYAKGIITKAERNQAVTIFMEDCMTGDVLALESYSEQSVVANERIWRKRIFSPEWEKAGIEIPPLVHLGLEKIVLYPLLKDFANPDSVVHEMLFNPLLRSSIITHLDGVFGCWNENKLKKLMDPRISRGERAEALKGAHSLFFWGVNKEGRSFPLGIVEEGNKAYFKKADGMGKPDDFVVPITPEALTIHLMQETLVPNLFLMMCVLATEAQLKLLGGPNQPDYLSTYQRLLAVALEETGNPRHRELGKRLIKIPLDHYASFSSLGLFFARYPNPNPNKPKIVRTAGALEIAVAGGITPAHFRAMDRMRVDRSIVLGLPPSRYQERTSHLYTLALEEARRGTSEEFLQDPIVDFDK